MSFQSLLKPSKHRSTISKIVSMRFLYSMTIITSVGLWLQQIQVLDKPNRLKSSYNTSLRLIIVSAILMGLSLLYLASFRKVKTGKIFCKQRILKSYIIWSFCWRMPVYQALWSKSVFQILFFQILAWHLYIKYLSVTHTFYQNYTNFGIR